MYILTCEIDNTLSLYEKIPAKIISLNRVTQFTSQILLENNKSLYGFNENINEILIFIHQSVTNKEFIISEILFKNERMKKIKFSKDDEHVELNKENICNLERTDKISRKFSTIERSCTQKKKMTITYKNPESIKKALEIEATNNLIMSRRSCGNKRNTISDLIEISKFINPVGENGINSFFDKKSENENNKFSNNTHFENYNNQSTRSVLINNNNINSLMGATNPISNTLTDSENLIVNHNQHIGFHSGKIIRGINKPSQIEFSGSEIKLILNSGYSNLDINKSLQLETSNSGINKNKLNSLQKYTLGSISNESEEKVEKVLMRAKRIQSVKQNLKLNIYMDLYLPPIKNQKYHSFSLSDKSIRNPFLLKSKDVFVKNILNIDLNNDNELLDLTSMYNIRKNLSSSSSKDLTIFSKNFIELPKNPNITKKTTGFEPIIKRKASLFACSKFNHFINFASKNNCYNNETKSNVNIQFEMENENDKSKYSQEDNDNDLNKFDLNFIKGYKEEKKSSFANGISDNINNYEMKRSDDKIFDMDMKRSNEKIFGNLGKIISKAEDSSEDEDSSFDKSIDNDTNVIKIEAKLEEKDENEDSQKLQQNYNINQENLKPSISNSRRSSKLSKTISNNDLPNDIDIIDRKNSKYKSNKSLLISNEKAENKENLDSNPNSIIIDDIENDNAEDYEKEIEQIEQNIENEYDEIFYMDFKDIMEYNKEEEHKDNKDSPYILEDENFLKFSFKEDKDNMELKIEDFNIVLNLSKGGYGTVDLCKKKKTQEIYAIKTSTQCLERLLMKETMILNEINHDALVRCFYIFSDEFNYYYVMEFVGGGDFSSFLKKIPTPNNTIVKLFLGEMILALEYLHSKNIYHRDVKPENILISATGHFKLADFGLSEGGNNGDNAYVVSTVQEIIKDHDEESSENSSSSSEDCIEQISSKKSSFRVGLDDNRGLNIEDIDKNSKDDF